MTYTGKRLLHETFRDPIKMTKSKENEGIKAPSNDPSLQCAYSVTNLPETDEMKLSVKIRSIVIVDQETYTTYTVFLVAFVKLEFF